MTRALINSIAEITNHIFDRYVGSMLILAFR